MARLGGHSKRSALEARSSRRLVSRRKPGARSLRSQTERNDNMKGAQNPIELWKAIHGGCWPGPPVDTKFNQQVTEVIAGLAMFNLANSFTDARVAQQTRTLASASLSTSLTA